jgi:hypothetical protein
VHTYIYQGSSVGNEETGVFPIWDIGGGSYEVPCYLDHVDYGLYLDVGDFNSGVLEYHIGDISETPDIGWRSLDITQYVIEDMQSGREYSQYRLRFPIDTDYDDMDDYLMFTSGDGLEGYRPYTRLVFTNGAAVDNEVSSEKNGIIIYPNPFRISTSIMFSTHTRNTRNTEIVIYNIRGEIVKKLELGRENGIQWDGKDINGNVVSNGLYLIKIKNDEINVIKKAIKLS